MTAAHPLPPPPSEDDLEVIPLTDAYLATLPEDVQRDIREGMAEAAAGDVRPWSEVEALIDEMRRRDG
jgi:hypothetical protein